MRILKSNAMPRVTDQALSQNSLGGSASLAVVMAMLLAVICTPLFADVNTTAIDEAAAHFTETMMGKDLPKEKTFGGQVMARFAAYDLQIKSTAIIKNLDEDKQFTEFLAGKGYALDTMPEKQLKECIVEYLQSNSRVPRDVSAWTKLYVALTAPWGDSIAAFREIQNVRPQDYPPQLIMLLRTTATSQECQEWFDLLKQAYVNGTNAQERSFCLTLVPKHALQFAKIEGAKDTLKQLEVWLGDLARTESPEKLSMVAELDMVRFFVVWSGGDHERAAELASRTRLRAMEPLCLVMAKKPREARAALEKLRSSPTLTEAEKKSLTSTEALVAELEKWPEPGPRYKIGLSDLMILKRQKLGSFQLTKDLGADGVEVDMGGLGDRETFASELAKPEVRAQYMAKARELNLEICSLAMTGFFAQSFAERPTVPRMIQDCVDTMTAMGVKVAFLPLGVKGDLQQNPELRPAIVERLKMAGKIAADAGVVIGVETSLPAAEEVKLLEEVGSPGIKIYFNFANAAKYGRDIPTELRTLGKNRICQIHCTNEDGVWLENDPKIDLPKIKKTLDGMGWRGWLVAERSRDASDPRNVKRNFGANTAYLKKVFQGG